MLLDKSRGEQGVIITRTVKALTALTVCGLSFGFAVPAFAQACPTSADAIDTDRPDTTNSSETVPIGSLQLENGVNIADWSGGTRLDGTNSRVRLGIADCAELLVDIPDYSFSPRNAGVRGFNGIAPAAKIEFEGLPDGLQVSLVAGAGLPTGASSNDGNTTKPYVQVPWSQEIGAGFSIHGMLTETWIPGQRSDSLFEETLSLERELSGSTDAFIEYVGDYPMHETASQVLNFGGAWRFTKLQQVDFHAGFGFTRAAPRTYFGVGYSLRIDSLF